jgi:hypothetical protein
MSPKPALRSAVIIRWPVILKVTVEINPAAVADDATVGIVGLRLLKIGGKFVKWQPDQDWRPAVAEFEFSSSRERDQFVARALEISGVSITTSE